MASNSDDWKQELNRMLDLIEKQSTESFERIDEKLMELGISMDDDKFRQNVQKMVNLR